MSSLRIGVTGLGGVLGTQLQASFSNPSSNFQIIDFFNTCPTEDLLIPITHQQLNLLETNTIETTLSRHKPDIIIHMAARTHIDACELDKVQDKKGIVWRTNVDATAQIAEYCRKKGSFLIFLSTECVFSGENIPTENSPKSPKNWYGFSKSAAEDEVLNRDFPAAIVRSVVAYHDHDQGKTIFGKVLDRLKKGDAFPAVNDQRFMPTYTLDIVKVLRAIIENRSTGIFHVAPKQSLTPYDFATTLAQHFDFSRELVVPQTLEEFFGPERAKLRLKNSCLNSEKTSHELRILPLSVAEAFSTMKL
jgi:dTDP-4-dehydrorhamnose reductase